MHLGDAVTCISGVGEKTKELLLKLDIATVSDLLYHVPRTYRDLRQITELSSLSGAQPQLCCATVATPAEVAYIRSSLTKISFWVKDKSGEVEVVLFNKPNVKNYLPEGKTLYLYGKLSFLRGRRPQIVSPDLYFQRPEQIMPVYPLTARLTQPAVRKAIKTALQNTDICEPYGEDFLSQLGLPSLGQALWEVHFPTGAAALKEARRRLAFDELIVFCCALMQMESNVRAPAPVYRTDGLDAFVKLLSFRPTDAQQRVMGDIACDLASGRVMNRLVQGDVGCGKTAVALFAMYAAAENGYQSALMAPTEILARQHYDQAASLFGQDRVVLLSGGQTAAQRRQALSAIAEGAPYVVGTHALICGGAQFRRLGLIVTDEQHKFGVRQRAALAGGEDVHTLVMSATPIPRSLVMVLYGNSDISVIDELPPGRTPVKTYLIRAHKYDTMMDFILREIASGRQAYFVCPLIEEDDDGGAKSAKALYEEIRGYFSGYTCALLHGKMKPAEKEAVMADFKTGKTKLLISTTVVEVGVDNPNATVMCVMNAERFGLAQLHQLRGRVGRGGAQSYCFLYSDSASAQERLAVVASTNDGFAVAQKDMELRGGGDVFGVRQHGRTGFRFASLVEDAGILEKTRDILDKMAESDRFRREYDFIRSRAGELYRQKMLELAFN